MFALCCKGPASPNAVAKANGNPLCLRWDAWAGRGCNECAEEPVGCASKERTPTANDLAAAQGKERADTNRDLYVAKRMTAQQIAEAQKLAAEWKPKPKQ